MTFTVTDIGKLVLQTRKQYNLTQRDVAFTSGTGLRFIVDLEKGKPTCQIGKVLRVLATLGIKVMMQPPPMPKSAL